MAKLISSSITSLDGDVADGRSRRTSRRSCRTPGRAGGRSHDAAAAASPPSATGATPRRGRGSSRGGPRRARIASAAVVGLQRRLPGGHVRRPRRSARRGCDPAGSRNVRAVMPERPEELLPLRVTRASGRRRRPRGTRAGSPCGSLPTAGAVCVGVSPIDRTGLPPSLGAVDRFGARQAPPLADTARRPRRFPRRGGSTSS